MKIELPPFDEKFGYCIVNKLNSDYYHTYIIQISGTNLYKIGVTWDLKNRLSSYNSPFEHCYVAIYSELRAGHRDYAAKHICRELERKLLKEYKNYSVRGEWVEMDADLSNRLITDLFLFGERISQDWIKTVEMA